MKYTHEPPPARCQKNSVAVVEANAANPDEVAVEDPLEYDSFPNLNVINCEAVQFHYGRIEEKHATKPRRSSQQILRDSKCKINQGVRDGSLRSLVGQLCAYVWLNFCGGNKQSE